MSTNINIVSGFLGAGKTTFLKRIIPKLEGKTVVIENEFGSVGIDGDLLSDKLPVREINAGCICCSVVQDFKKAIEELTLEYRPNQILIEPSGVGSLSDILKVCKKLSANSELDIKINHLITIVDVSAFKDYVENFGGFYLDQIKNAGIIFLSHFDKMEASEVEGVISAIRLNNSTALIVEEDWISYDAEGLIEILEANKNYEIAFEEGTSISPANKVFNSFSVTNPKIFTEVEIDNMLVALKDRDKGYILRAKGVLELESNEFINFNYTPHHYSWEYLKKPKTCKVAVIGSKLNNKKISALFQR